jgi:hypothetical protein
MTVGLTSCIRLKAKISVFRFNLSAYQFTVCRFGRCSLISGGLWNIRLKVIGFTATCFLAAFLPVSTSPCFRPGLL